MTFEIDVVEEVVAIPADHDYVKNTSQNNELADDDITLGLGVLVKKPNSTSVVWDYFGFKSDKNGYAIDNSKPQCRTCLREVPCKSGNTSNLFKHLKDHHPLVPDTVDQLTFLAKNLDLADQYYR